MDETKWKLCLIRKEGEDFVLNVVNLSAGKKCDQKKKEKKCSVCIHYLNATMPFTKKRFSMPVRSMFCCLRYECLMRFHSDLAIPGDLSAVVRFLHSTVWHIHRHGNGCMTCDPSLQVFKGCNSSLIKSVIHAAKLERTGRMLSSAHSNDFLAQCVHPSSANSFDYPLKLEHINGINVLIAWESAHSLKYHSNFYFLFFL